jgi:hypothetical protein
MEFEKLMKALGVLAVFIGLYLTAIKVRRDEKLHCRKTILDDLAILEKLNSDELYFERIRTNIQKSILRSYPPHRIFDRAMAYSGLLLCLAGGTVGVYLFIGNNNLSWLLMFLSVVGIELQRRSLLPGGAVNPPAIQLKRKDT